jgi:hypothetical protein
MEPCTTSLGKGDAVFKTEGYLCRDTRCSYYAKSVPHGHAHNELMAWSTTDPNFKVAPALDCKGKSALQMHIELSGNPEQLLCTRCAGNLPHGYEVPPVPIGGWMKEVRESQVRLEKKFDLLLKKIEGL